MKKSFKNIILTFALLICVITLVACSNVIIENNGEYLADSQIFVKTNIDGDISFKTYEFYANKDTEISKIEFKNVTTEENSNAANMYISFKVRSSGNLGAYDAFDDFNNFGDSYFKKDNENIDIGFVLAFDFNKTDYSINNFYNANKLNRSESLVIIVDSTISLSNFKIFVKA